MKVALVGVGYWGSKILRALVPLVGAENIVAADPHIDRLAAACAEHPRLGLATSLEAALAHDEVEAAFIATPLHTHHALAKLAIEAGRHVFVEKPLTMSSDEARELATLADDHQVTLMVGHTYLFSPRVECVAALMEQGAIGAPHYVTSSRLNLGPVRNDTNVIWDLAAHDFSIIFHLLREFPQTIQTLARSVVRSGAADVAFMNMAFPSGVVASVTVSWLAPRKVRNTILVGESRMIVYDDTKGDEPVRVFDKGVLAPESSDFGENQLTYRYGDTVAPHVAPHEPLTRELAHFISALRGTSPCISDGWFGVRIVEALAAADLSARSGGIPVHFGGGARDASIARSPASAVANGWPARPAAR